MASIMTLAANHPSIRAWLETLFEGEPIPNYEVNQESLELLSEIAKLSQSRKRSLTAAAEVQRRQAEEYRAEAKRISNNLAKLNLSPDELSGPTGDFVEVLAELAQVLGLDEPTEDELALKLAEVQLKTAKIPAKDYSNRKELDSEKEEKLKSIENIARSKQVLKKAEKDLERSKAQTNKFKNELHFLGEKSKEYDKKSFRHESELKKNGYSKEIDHDSILALRKQLDDLEETHEPLKTKLKSYQSLPPDLELGRVKVAEAQKELDDLSHQLTKEISGLHI